MKTATSIEIDLDVYKTIILHSNYIDEPANDVLRRLLKLNKQITSPPQENEISSEREGLFVKGIFLHNGLQLKKSYKGVLHQAQVLDGYILFNNEKFTTPSGAAVKAAQGSVNGWIFWDFYDIKDGKWKSLETLREGQ